MNKETKIQHIFKEIYATNICGDDPRKVPRNIEKTNIDADVMIIAEAMAPGQVRLSGVNYFFPDGKIGSTGKNLEKFLNKFDRTVYPDKKNCIYHTEIVHSFPGYTYKASKKTIRKPTSKEILLSIKTNILEREIDVIKPKVILLMGNTAYKTFYRYFLELPPTENLTKEIERISDTGEFHKYKDIPVFPIQHASGANPRFNSMLQSKELIEIIKGILQ
jgi:uracil-DNA glycosylase family 4